MSVVLRVIFPNFFCCWFVSISIDMTSPSIISDSSLIHIPIDLLKAWVKDSVFDISSEKISEAEIDVNGVFSPNDLHILIAIAVFPVPGYPPSKIAHPAI